ncbi:hypothetical protein [Phosphitispora fastidiosa]|uniref:hypothetical protein n=1 Tax=Phosphitispora fastidiosa TaxID=2837202 RepID=UPI001E6031FE|nr:hypothetical protein [Phosphitispora fastidiosa]MBU7008839.1 hypothetical protein [Phosphitispora fastidiosa]
MKKWSADFTNDPDDDYNLIIDVWYGDEHSGQIRNSIEGLEIVWFPNDQVRNVPLDWFLGVLLEAKKALKHSD